MPRAHLEVRVITSYQIWDMESGNRLALYSTLKDALEFVREAVRQYGAHTADEWDLIVVSRATVGSDDRTKVSQFVFSLAHGEDLAAMSLWYPTITE